MHVSLVHDSMQVCSCIHLRTWPRLVVQCYCRIVLGPIQMQIQGAWRILHMRAVL